MRPGPPAGDDAYVYTLTYDNAGNVKTANDPFNGSWSYSYDTLNRLVSAADNAYEGTRIVALGAALTLQCWVYDSFGNRTYELVNASSCPSPGTTPTSWTHQLSYTGSPNRVTSIDGNALQYDAAGNVIQDPNNNYIYDQEGRLCAVENILAGTATQYVYDAEGTRVANGTINTWPTAGNPCAAPTVANNFHATSIWLKSANGGQDTQILPGQGPAPSYDPVLNTNVYLGSSMLATYNFTTTEVLQGGIETDQPVLNLSFAFSDWLGSKRLQINSAGQATNTWASDPFGNYLTPSASGGSDATDHHFTGKERDSESGNDYFGARYYASSMGRWLSPDWSAKEEPVPYAKLDDPQSLNLYGYVGNNPLSKADPDGHCPFCIPLLAGGGSVLAGTEEGAAIGAFGGPVGAGIGAVIGLGVGLYVAHEISEHSESEPAPAAAAPAATEAPATAPAATTTQGVYEFPDASSPGKTYVGQSGDVPRRLGEHEASGKKDAATPAKTTEVQGGKTAREVTETKRIKELGGTSSKEGSQTSNKRLPVSDKRMEKINNGSSN